jgi:FMN-dependent oxidoreductase (nitrilotriacetate monooxygenase family)
MSKRLIFCAFTMNTVSHIYHGLWRHPETRQLEYTNLDTWVDLAKLLERGKFDAIFLADVIGLYGDYRGGWETYVREGLQIPSNDPSVLISALAYATENLGLAFTSSIVQEHPFNFARKVSTLDHLSKGRIAWNIVTNALANGSRNFGLDDLTEHDERYSWAHEYLEVVYKLWEGSWEDDALLRDTANGIHADPTKIHKIYHQGKRFKVEGPHLPAPSPQRTPVLAQAGSSRAGRDFAALHAEAQFLIAPHPHAAKAQIQDVRARAMHYGRRREDILFLQGLSFVVGSTEEEAHRKELEIDEFLSADGMLAHASGGIGIDLGEIPWDQPIGQIQVEGVRSILEAAIASVPNTRGATVADVARLLGKTTRITGTPEQIADRLEDWAAAGIDGVNVMYSTTPGTFADFIEYVAPELQRRGLMQREYRPGTFRQKLFGGSQYLPDRHIGRSYRRNNSHAADDECRTEKRTLERASIERASIDNDRDPV